MARTLCWFSCGAADAVGAEGADFQAGVDKWMDACFGATIKADKVERADRFIEEALELAQTMPGFNAGRAHDLVDYVFGRDQGEINQEVGGVMVTLAALCNTVGVNIEAEANRELARVWTKVEQIRAKQAAKPTGSALPVAPPKPEAIAVEGAVEALHDLCAAAYTRGYREGCDDSGKPVDTEAHGDGVSQYLIDEGGAREVLLSALSRPSQANEGEIERLREALKPFAIEIGAQWADSDPAPTYLFHNGKFKVGDFRRAAALSPSPDAEGDEHA